ncbi:TPT-domain-containing protein [Violaceomyces palustris]|uniref:TPT-domain-containing protein n=1 Tax=Violaceomyces palustris TaxID=1673888 RepID=A0ACD0NUS4_9BASI|nr:TPT-domain-containing protein [Violaceomyces palustris]
MLPTHKYNVASRSTSSSSSPSNHSSYLFKRLLSYLPPSSSNPASTYTPYPEKRGRLLSSTSHRGVSSFNAPSRSTVVLLIACLLWYTSSALSSNTSKALLSKPKLPTSQSRLPTSSPHPLSASPPFPYPATLTLVQFLFVNLGCYLCSSKTLLGNRRLTRMVIPARERIIEVLKLSIFNVLGHAASSLAISRVPVSTVHTIKALSPLFTVLSFAVLFRMSYSLKTYISLLPLTVGVVLACSGFSFDSDDVIGFSASLASTFIFVAQNIYSKKLLRQGEEDKVNVMGSSNGKKLDKLNILFYSSACSVVVSTEGDLSLPMVLYYDGASLLNHLMTTRASRMDAPSQTSRALTLLTLNGLFQFSQNILAFNVLGMVSPVTYSIASLFKRVFVIVLAILWFGQRVSPLQWLGILLTFSGLYLYNDSKIKDQRPASSLAVPSHIASYDEKVPPNLALPLVRDPLHP